MSLFNIASKNKWVKTSYAQTGEDLIIRFIFDQLQIARPTYIDVGAHHPFYLSNTALFYQSGSRGINIEPDPHLYKGFLQHRKKDLNLNIGIGETEGDADFFIISSPTLNTFSKSQAEGYKKEGDYRITNVIKTRINTLKNIIDDYNNGIFPQLLNLDAEGIDELILHSVDYATCFPLVMCIETISFSTSGNGIRNTALIDYVKSKGYRVYADTYINTIFVHEATWKKQNK
jgi:FkbM family methyltransferase